MKHKLKYLAIPILVLLIILPIGLITENPAWGEWGLDYFKKLLGFVPEGMEKNKDLINPPVPDYSVRDKHPVVSYYISAVLGILIVFGVFFGIKVFIKNER